jgi:two-component system, cell cycle sensor histidine kinase and response regulator CckA
MSYGIQGEVMERKATVLVVDDKQGPRESVRMILKNHYNVLSASRGMEALNLVETQGDDIDVVLLDIRMPDTDGISVLREIKRRNPDIEVAMITAYASVETAGNALRLGAFDYLQKPFSCESVEEIVFRGVSKRQGRRESKKNLQQLLLAKNALLGEHSALEGIAVRTDGILTADMNGRVVMMNRIAERLTGWEQAEACGRPLEDVFKICCGSERIPFPHIAQSIITAGCLVGLTKQSVLLSRNGEEYLIADSGAVVQGHDKEALGLVVVFRDITETILMEHEIMRAKQLESLGLLAGGIAHDFNNYLTAMLGNITLARREAKEGTDLCGRLQDAEKATLRAKGLAQLLLTFSKGGNPVKQAAFIGELLKDSAGFALHGSKVTCSFMIADDLLPAEVDKAQIGQVISNLVINAVQAMPEGGEIFITAENLAPGEFPNGSNETGRYICLSVRDTGHGIPDHVLPRIFDPYFSTRKNGSGLGLASAYSIVKQHGGMIKVYSTLGEGSKFRVFLPATDKEPISTEDLQDSGHERLSGRVLVMDDDLPVREVAGMMLQLMGCTVDFAADGAEALEVYSRARDRGQPFSAVIMDLTISGGMGGKETIGRLLEIDPAARVVVCSGLSNDPILADCRKFGFRDAVAKPYRLEELTEVLSRVLKENETDGLNLRTDPCLI